MATTLLHLVGSAESDVLAELSSLYARDCLEVLGEDPRYDSVIAYVAPDRRWRFPEDLDPSAVAAARPMALPAAVDHIARAGVDAVIPQMFCRRGMTEYRSLFDTLEIPYLGNRADTMALAAHKPRAKAVVAAAGVAVPEAVVVVPGDPVDVAPPVVVKPVDGDNSVATTFVTRPEDLAEAIDAAAAQGSAAMVERYVQLGREVRCAVLERRGSLDCLPIEEYAVDPQTKPIRDEADKLRRDVTGRLELVAKDSSHAWIVGRDDPVCEAVGAAARRCHVAMGCRHYSLFDFRIDPAGTPWFLEASLYCSFARQSVIATMARAAGVEPAQLFAEVLSATLQPPSSRSTA